MSSTCGGTTASTTGTWSISRPGTWSHLVDRPREVLHQLAGSANMWERRTAVLATYPLIKRKQFDDTFAIVDELMADPEDLIHKACGWMLRCVSDADLPAFHGFVEPRAAKMPRTMLRAAIEKLPPDERKRMMGVGK